MTLITKLGARSKMEQGKARSYNTKKKETSKITWREQKKKRDRSWTFYGTTGQQVGGRRRGYVPCFGDGERSGNLEAMRFS